MKTHIVLIAGALLGATQLVSGAIFNDDFSGTTINPFWSAQGGAFSTGGGTSYSVSDGKLSLSVERGEAKNINANVNLGTDVTQDFNFFNQDLTFIVSDVSWFAEPSISSSRRWAQIFITSQTTTGGYYTNFPNIGMQVSRNGEIRLGFTNQGAASNNWAWVENTVISESFGSGYATLDEIRLTVGATSYSLVLVSGSNTHSWSGTWLEDGGVALSSNGWDNGAALVLSAYATVSSDPNMDVYGATWGGVTVIPEPGHMGVSFGLLAIGALLLFKRFGRRQG